MKKIPIYPETKALIFDCDGTLVDSMPLHMKSWEYAMNKLNIDFDYDFFFSRKGMRESDIVEILNKEKNINLDTEAVVNLKHDYFLKNIHHVKPIEEVVEIVHNYKDILPMAVVSGGVKKLVLEELKIVGIDKFFNVILTADDDIKPKPSPDLFLHASQILNIPPENCQVFEDGELGIQAALNAKMFVTDVRNYISNNTK
ncbi:MAG: HAD family phosphatase [Melioribacteraceae bacterium]